MYNQETHTSSAEHSWQAVRHEIYCRTPVTHWNFLYGPSLPSDVKLENLGHF